MMCWNDTYSKYYFFQEKDKYSVCDTLCQRFLIHITKILVSYIHKNAVMSEHTVSTQSSMQIVPTRLPLIVLQRVEEQFPAYREIMVSAMCMCADKGIVSSYSEDLYGPMNKMVYSILMLPFILCALGFYGWFLISVRLNVLCNFSSISMMICSMLVMTGHVLICCAYIRGYLEVSII